MATTAKPQEGGRRPRKTRLLDETFTVPLALSTVDAIDRVRDVRLDPPETIDEVLALIEERVGS